ncbi:DUF58 domain-containing protein [Rheinheimera texasensis]|uniref:DUF58 domain-containing protein n=1 Tax=Rheinheimera texasensis TaxID=306205 RepID=UPI00068B630A|nr:DUF58 domain-containing protein [Rheinheimera texasensis]
MSTQQSKQTVAAQLEALSTDGVHLDLPQLLQYQHHTYLLDLAPKQVIQSKLAGSYLARSKGRGMEFDEVRHYQPGDDVRTIDWRVTARTGKVHTKLFREEKERPVFVLTDLSPGMHFGSVLLTKAVQAAHLAALVGWHAKNRGDKFGGILFNGSQIRELKPASRSVAVLRYLQQLLELGIPAKAPATTQYSLAEAVGQLRRLVRPGSLIYIISDFFALDGNVMRHLQSMRQHNEIRLCQILDPLEQQLPMQVQGQLRVQSTQEVLQLDLTPQAIKQQYQQQQQQLLQQQQTFWRSLGLRHVQISTALPLRQQLSSTDAPSGMMTQGAAHG